MVDAVAMGKNGILKPAYLFAGEAVDIGYITGAAVRDFVDKLPS